MKCLLSRAGLSVALFLGWLSAAASACPVAIGVAVAVPATQIAVSSIAVPVAVAPIVAAPVSIIAAPVAVLSAPVVFARIRVRSPRRFRTPVRSLLFR